MTAVDQDRGRDVVEAVNPSAVANLQLPGMSMEGGPKSDNTAATAVLARSGVVSDLQIVDDTKDQGAGAAGDGAFAVMPRDATVPADKLPLAVPAKVEGTPEARREAVDRGQGQGADRGGEGSIALPSREDIQTKPISELKDWLSRNARPSYVARHIIVIMCPD